MTPNSAQSSHRGDVLTSRRGAVATCGGGNRSNNSKGSCVKFNDNRNSGSSSKDADARWQKKCMELNAAQQRCEQLMQEMCELEQKMEERENMSYGGGNGGSGGGGCAGMASESCAPRSYRDDALSRMARERQREQEEQKRCEQMRQELEELVECCRMIRRQKHLHEPLAPEYQPPSHECYAIERGDMSSMACGCSTLSGARLPAPETPLIPPAVPKCINNDHLYEKRVVCVPEDDLIRLMNGPEENYNPPMSYAEQQRLRMAEEDSCDSCADSDSSCDSSSSSSSCDCEDSDSDSSDDSDKKRSSKKRSSRRSSSSSQQDENGSGRKSKSRSQKKRKTDNRNSEDENEEDQERTTQEYYEGDTSQQQPSGGRTQNNSRRSQSQSQSHSQSDFGYGNTITSAGSTHPSVNVSRNNERRPSATVAMLRSILNALDED